MNFIIRPPRDNYADAELGPEIFTMAGKPFKRTGMGMEGDGDMPVMTICILYTYEGTDCHHTKNLICDGVACRFGVGQPKEHASAMQPLRTDLPVRRLETIFSE